MHDTNTAEEAENGRAKNKSKQVSESETDTVTAAI